MTFAHPKKKWSQTKKSKSMTAECPEEKIQQAVDEYLEWNKIDCIRIPDKIFKWIKMNTPRMNTPRWFQIWFFKIFGGRPDCTLVEPIGDGLAVSLLLELKTQDAKGRAVGSLHGKQRHHADEWVVCRSVDSAIAKIEEFKAAAKLIKEYANSMEFKNKLKNSCAVS